MSRTITLANGQQFVVISLPEATSILDCSIDELGTWIANCMVNVVECPGCRYVYPLQSDIKSLSGYIADFPTSVSLDDIVNKRFDEMKQMRKRGAGLFGRNTDKPLRQPEERPASRPSPRQRQQLPPLRRHREEEYEEEYEQPRMRKNDGPSARTPGRR